MKVLQMKVRRRQYIFIDHFLYFAILVTKIHTDYVLQVISKVERLEKPVQVEGGLFRDALHFHPLAEDILLMKLSMRITLLCS